MTKGCVFPMQQCVGVRKIAVLLFSCFFKVISLLFISDMSPDILPPLAVIPVHNVDNSEASVLQQYAQESNSNLVYAQDAFVNNIAVGVFVTEEFNPSVKNVFPMEISDDHQDPTWVGGTEECFTEGNEYAEIPQDSQCKRGKYPCL